MRKQSLLLSILIISLTGCVSPRQMTLFSTQSNQATLPQPPAFVIEPNDALKIEFTSINKESVEPYNSAGTSYIVREDGTVDIPMLGSVQLAGKNVDEAIAWLTEKVSGYVMKPLVVLRVTNASITILGEVNKPARISIDQPITMQEALGYVGGLTKNAKLKDVQVHRRENGVVKHYHVNLLTDELFSSPCYYLQKGDVVNIAPLFAK